MSEPKIFNPLRARAQASAHDNVATSGDAQVATAAIYNEIVGECPKCHTKMTTAVIANSDSVYFCAKCRVATPLQDS